MSETGVAGLTLSGGYSNQRRAHGMSIDSLIGCDVVTADGAFVHASAHEHPELFWALRGGGNFGIVTAFEYRAHPHGPLIYQAEVMYPVDQAPEIVTGWRDALQCAPDAITSDAAYWTIPASPELPPQLEGVPTLIVAAQYAGPADEAE
ncbi:MAG TPA: hypothetical protein VES02_14430 [Dermatophilaceae bacterium]|nr:hypothetical protein [Dermatophilaceae bacterium]